MAMFMQDQDVYSLMIVDDNSIGGGGKKDKSKVGGSPHVAKAECVFNPRAGNGESCWKSGDWLVDTFIPADGSVDVVTIVGPLAHGKSHSLNTRIFNDMVLSTDRSGHGGVYPSIPAENPIFEEQREADSPGTIGVWAAYQNYEKFLVFDTQGYYEKPLYEVAERDPTAVSAVRNAVKLMAMSDVVIFHTSTPRIDPVETFRFLQEASVVMEERLRPALGRTSKPVLIVFHQVLQEHPLDAKSHKFRSLLGQSVFDAFSEVHYMPVVRTLESDFGALNAVITQDRAALPPSTRETIRIAFDTLFSPETEQRSVIEDKRSIVPFELFSCPYKCLACGKSCGLLPHSPNRAHKEDGESCKYAESLKNRRFFCKACHNEATMAGYSSNDYSVVKFFKYYTQGANTINCKNCKVIYSSDQGVWPPDERCLTVETLTSHVWDAPGLATAQTAATIAPTVYYSRALLDPVVDVTESLVSILKPKAQVVHQMFIDKVRPAYWTPDEEATQCKICSVSLPEPGDKHHCRQCGKIFCDNCSSHMQPVPERGWGETPVRVCNLCFGTKNGLVASSEDPTAGAKENSVGGRWLFEQVGKVVSVADSVKTAVAGAVVSQTMPDYWQKDGDPGAHLCSCCNSPFDKVTSLTVGATGPGGSNGGSNSGSSTSLADSMSASTAVSPSDKRRHHCRMCGKFVCGSCSLFRMPVPERGWGERPVRVCNNCKLSSSQSGLSTSVTSR